MSGGFGLPNIPEGLCGTGNEAGETNFLSLPYNVVIGYLANLTITWPNILDSLAR